jgi:hypothetical protein
VPLSDGLGYVIQIGGGNPEDCSWAEHNYCASLEGVFTASSICVPAGTCNYTNAFSLEPECKEYTGMAWRAASAQENCQAGQVGADPGTWSENLVCEVDPTLGWCAVPDPDELQYVIQIGGSDPAECSWAENDYCAGSLEGVFTASSICAP